MRSLRGSWRRCDGDGRRCCVVGVAGTGGCEDAACVCGGGVCERLGLPCR
jgi:hypothetical protein